MSRFSSTLSFFPCTCQSNLTCEASRGAAGSQPFFRVGGPALDGHHEMQVAAGRIASGTGITNGLPRINPITFGSRITAQMVVRRFETARVFDNQSKPIAGIEVNGSDHSARRCMNARAAWHTEVGAVVQFADARDGMHAHAEAGCDGPIDRLDKNAAAGARKRGSRRGAEGVHQPDLA